MVVADRFLHPQLSQRDLTPMRDGPLLAGAELTYVAGIERRGWAEDEDPTASAAVGSLAASGRTEGSGGVIPRPYRRLFALPRVGTTVLLMFMARLPMAAVGVLMTLHVVTALDRGYTAAGLVGTATMVGTAVGAPLLGRFIDRHGARPVVLIAGTASAAFWLCVPLLPYPVLLPLALPAGAVTLPVSLLARHYLMALVPEAQHRTAFSLDAVATETAFIVGPSVTIVVLVHFSSTVALVGTGLWFALVTIILHLANLPVRRADQAPHAVDAARPRGWLDGRMTGALLIVVGALFTLIGAELAMIATLETHEEHRWTGVVIAAMAGTSAVGGLLYGAVRRSFSQATLALVLTLLALPAGLVNRPWWLLAVALVPMSLTVAPMFAASTERVSRLAPAQVRGTALGLLDSATRIGMALGAPLVGMMIDRSSAGWGFVTAGLGGLALIGAGALSSRFSTAKSPRRSSDTSASRNQPLTAPPARQEETAHTACR